MPVCLECHGTGQIEVKTEVTTRCPDCGGSKLLPDGTRCKRCNKYGEIGTGEFKVETKLCTTCWGSGTVSEGSLTVWYLVRVVPAALVLLGGGGTAAWFSWMFLEMPLVTALLIIFFAGSWGILTYYFTSQLPSLGEISVTNWFLIRAIPTTLVAIVIGLAANWVAWDYTEDMRVVAVFTLAAFAIWGVLMYYFISHLPE